MRTVYDFPPPNLNLTMSSLEANESQRSRKHIYIQKKEIYKNNYTKAKYK